MERKIPDIYFAEISPKFLKSVYEVELKRGSTHGRITFYGPVHLRVFLSFFDLTLKTHHSLTDDSGPNLIS